MVPRGAARTRHRALHPGPQNRKQPIDYDIELYKQRNLVERMFGRLKDWALIDEPIVNKHFETLAGLDATVAERCAALDKDRDLVKGPAGFHWWPERASPI